MHGCCGTAEGQRKACAGAYVFGAAGKNECPAGSVRIETEAACRTAAAAAGKTFFPVQTDPAYPRGCYHRTSWNDAYFNTHAVGAGSPNYRLLCAAITTGAPPLHQVAHARVCVHRRVRRHCACVVTRVRRGTNRALKGSHISCAPCRGRETPPRSYC